MSDISPESINVAPMESAKLNASEHLLSSVRALRTDELNLRATDFSVGAACKNKPEPGDILTLSSDLKSTGCTFKKFPNKPNSSAGLEVSALFESVVDQSIIVNSLGIASFGSGVIAGKNGPGECLGLTDLHVITGGSKQADLDDILSLTEDKPAERVLDLNIVSVDGKTYPAELRATDAKIDVAVVAFKTGADTDKVCKPAKFAADTSALKTDAPTYTVGFPEQSPSPYLSVGTWQGWVILSDLDKDGGAEVAPGEDITRKLWSLGMPVRSASSGGPSYNLNGEVFGLVDRVNNERHRSFTTPLTQSIVDGLIESSRKPVPARPKAQ